MNRQITELFGLNVYTERSVSVGEVEDVIIDVDNKKVESLVIGSGKLNPSLVDVKNYKGIKIPYRIIQSVGDVIIIHHIPGAFRAADD